MSSQPRIVSNPSVLQGKPCVAGTRISVEHILREMAAGATVAELVEDYPGLTPEEHPGLAHPPAPGAGPGRGGLGR